MSHHAVVTLHIVAQEIKSKLNLPSVQADNVHFVVFLRLKMKTRGRGYQTERVTCCAGLWDSSVTCFSVMSVVEWELTTLNSKKLH